MVKITEVIAAGPASKGIAIGKMLILSLLSLIDLFFLSDRISNNIYKAIRNKITPPAIVNAEKEMPKYFRT